MSSNMTPTLNSSEWLRDLINDTEQNCWKTKKITLFHCNGNARQSETCGKFPTRIS